MTYYIYILYSPGSDIYYVGYTNDYLRRLEEHNTSDKQTFTLGHRPWSLMAVYSCGENKGFAVCVERFIKKQKSRSLLKKMVDGVALTGILASLVRVF